MKRKVILLVEDYPSDVGLTRRVLEKSRIANELVVAEDGQVALDYLFAPGRDPGDLPANSYIRKPVDFTQFAQAIDHLGPYWLVLNEPPAAKSD